MFLSKLKDSIVSKHFKKFIDNRQAIEDRVLGAVTRYFLAMDAQSDQVTTEGLRKIHASDTKSENVAYYYEATMKYVEAYFNTESTSGAWSDFQCTLALAIYGDYTRK